MADRSAGSVPARGVVAVLAVAAAAIALWLGTAAPGAHGAPAAPAAAATPGNRAADATPANPGDTCAPAARALVAAAAPDERSFRSVDLDGEPVAAVQDGITFVVRTRTGAPVAGAPIRVGWYRADARSYQGADLGATDAQGAFRSSVHRVDELDGVEVEVPGLGSTTCTADLLLAALQPATVVLVAPDTTWLTVTVVDRSGAPIEGAAIDVRHAATLGQPREYPLQGPPVGAHTDRDGAATVAVAAGRCAVRASAPDFQGNCALHCDLPPGRSAVRCRLEPRSAVREVRVSVRVPPDLDGDVTLGCETSSFAPQDPQPAVVFVEGERRWLEGRRTAPGEYVVRVEPVAWHLRVTAEGCAPFARWIEPDEDAVLVTLAREDPALAFVVRGRVLGPAGAPAADAEIWWHTAARPNGTMAARADVDGRFALRRPADGRVWLSAWRGDAAPAWVGPWHGDGRSLDLELRLGEPLAIPGVLLGPDGRPITGTVRIAAVGAAERAETRAVAADGTFHFGQLPAGDYELFAAPDASEWPARCTARAGQRVVLRSGEGLEGLARIELSVVDPFTTLPVEGALVGDHAVTDAAGKVRLAVPPGDVELLLAGEGFAARMLRLAAPAGAAMRRTVELPREVVRFVRFVDADGRPLADCEIAAVDAARGDGARWPTTASTDAHGRAELCGLPAGSHRLVLERYRRDDTGLLYTERGAEREFVLADGAGERQCATFVWQ